MTGYTCKDCGHVVIGGHPKYPDVPYCKQNDMLLPVSVCSGFKYEFKGAA